LEELLFDDADRFRNGKTVNLVQKWDQIGNTKKLNLSTIAETLSWMQGYMKEEAASFLEYLEWSHTYLLNSMKPALSEIVLSTLKEDYMPSQIGGPLTFAIMIDRVINLSETAIDAMTTSIRNYRLTSIDGENVELVSRRLRYAFRRLHNNNSLSNDLVRSYSKFSIHLPTLTSTLSCSSGNVRLKMRWCPGQLTNRF